MADIKTANLAKLVSKQAGRAKEKVGPPFKRPSRLLQGGSLTKEATCASRRRVTTMRPTQFFDFMVQTAVLVYRRPPWRFFTAKSVSLKLGHKCHSSLTRHAHMASSKISKK